MNIFQHKTRKYFIFSIPFFIISALFSLNAAAYTASASSHSGNNVAANVLDGDVNTRWAVKGKGEYIVIDLESTTNLTGIMLAFHKGDKNTTQFQVQTSTNNSSYSTVISKATSSGNTIWNQTFSFSQVSARYVKIIATKSSGLEITKFTAIKSGGSTDNGTDNGGTCDKPSDVLDLTNWKITIPYTTSTGSTDGNTKNAAEVTQPALDNYERSPEFTNSGCDYVQFRAHAGGATTSGSGYPRSELREMSNNGSSNASWSSTSGTHTMEVKLRATKLPSVKPHLVVAQIHDDDDDVITFRLEDKKMMLEIDGSDGPTLDSSYSLGETVTLKWVVSGGKTYSYYNGKLVHTLTKSYSGAYFKTGAYTQSACGGNNEVDGESCSAYGETEIFDLKVSH